MVKAEEDLAKVAELYKSTKIKIEKLERALKEAVELRCKDITSLQ